MERPATVELTSGASGRINHVFRNVRRSVPSMETLVRLFVFLQSLALWFLLFLRRRRPFSGKPLLSPSSPLASPRRVSIRGGGVFRRGSGRVWRALSAKEEEDAMIRRALAERVAMASDGEGDEEESYKWDKFVLSGPRRNAIFCRSWVPTSGEMRGILVIIHGLNEHSGRYSHFAKQLTQCKFGVYAMDWIGHGGSDGLHGYVPSLDYVVEDIGAFVEKIESEYPDVPCFLFGHSTGGAAVLKAMTLLSQVTSAVFLVLSFLVPSINNAVLQATLYPPIMTLVKGIILTSPAIRVKPAHPIVGAVAPIFSLVLPKFQFKGANKRGIPVSRDPAAMLAKYSDPLVYTGPIRVRTGHEILRISSFLLQNLKSVTVPFMVLHGTADRVTDPMASQDLFNVAASKHKDIKLYEGFLHDLLFEPERDAISADIIDWMMTRLQHQGL